MHLLIINMVVFSNVSCIFPSSPLQRPIVTIDNETVFSVNDSNPWPLTYGTMVSIPKVGRWISYDLSKLLEWDNP